MMFLINQIAEASSSNLINSSNVNGRETEVKTTITDLQI